MSILIAEDNVAQRRYLRELLEREFTAHAPVIEAGDGEQTIEMALQHRPQMQFELARRREPAGDAL